MDLDAILVFWCPHCERANLKLFNRRVEGGHVELLDLHVENDSRVRRLR